MDRKTRIDSDIELSAPSSLVGMTMSLLELLTTLMTKGAVRGVIQPALVPVLTSIASYMILAADEDEGDDLNYTTTNNQNTYHHTVRNYCREFISQVIEAFDDQAVEALIYVCEKFLRGSDERQSSLSTDFEEIDVLKNSYECSDPRYKDKKKEVGLYLLGTYSDDIMKFRSRRSLDQFNMSIFDLILDVGDSKEEVIIGRSLWCATQLAEILPQDDPHLLELFQRSTLYLEKQYRNSIRFCACRSLILFTKQINSGKESE